MCRLISGSGFLLLLISLAVSGREIGDPMRPASMNRTTATGQAALTRDKWALDATIISGDQKLAIINGKQCRVGDFINGARLVDIARGSVVYEIQGHRFGRNMKMELTQPIKKSPITAHAEKGTP